MPLKRTGTATEWREIDRWPDGVGWIAHPEEDMQRASHALAVDGDVWLVDPVDAPGVDELFADFGDVAGVVVLVDRHTRDAAALAERHGVSVHLPRWMSGVAADVDAPVELADTRLGDTSYGIYQSVDVPFWREGVLYDEDTGTMVVGDALGTAPYFLSVRERIGVHPLLRAFPPRKLGRLSPERILTGHGEGIHDRATDALDDALAGARSRAPGLYARTAREFLLG